MLSELPPPQVLVQFNPLQSLPVDRLTLVNGGFSGASVWRVCAESAEYSLRRWPPETSNANRIRAIHRLTRHVGAAGLGVVPIPVPSRSGETLLQAESGLWQLECWMPGTADFKTFPAPERLRSALVVLAQWHLAAARFQPAALEQEWLTRPMNAPSPTIIERLESIDFLLKNRAAIGDGITTEPEATFREAAGRIIQHFDALSRRLRNELAAWREVAVPLQPCLRDVWHDHLLFTGDELTGLIDFGAVRTDTVACDLSRLLGSLFPTSADRWPEALAAYEACRVLSGSERSLIGPLYRSGTLLSGMTWLKRRYLQRSLSQVTAAVSGRLTAIAESLERLAARLDNRTPAGLILPD